jgi:uncharacterized short protein YbdD (DUF466 family)
MSRRALALKETAGKAGRYLAQSMRLMVGVPSYDAYVAHMAARHPGRAPMTYGEFFADRQRARYARAGAARCC